MATIMDVKGTKAFCDEVYTKLTGMKKTLTDLQTKTKMIGPESDNEVVETFRRHLCEIAEEIDWKLQILAHSCPYNWQGSEEFEDTVKVSVTDRSPEIDEVSGGYLGG